MALQQFGVEKTKAKHVLKFWGISSMNFFILKNEKFEINLKKLQQQVKDELI